MGLGRGEYVSGICWEEGIAGLERRGGGALGSISCLCLFACCSLKTEEKRSGEGGWDVAGLLVEGRRRGCWRRVELLIAIL